ncbi:MAG: hypothetical protein PHG26_05775, partial [Dehalococcoidales bacterium]|nr:hypothetical protein [Dehalococcoidales bacterium]
MVSSAIIIFSFSFFGQEPFSGSKGEGATLFASGYVYGEKSTRTGCSGALFYQNLISLPEVKKNNKPSSWLKGGFEKEAKSSTKRETMSNP